MELPDSSGAANSRAQEGTSLRRFVQHAILWNIGLFALIRLPWTADVLAAGLIQFQTSLIYWYGARPNPGIVVDTSCSGADVAALCLGVTLAYPVAWRQRVIGAVIGVAGIIALNTVRIATLLALASSPETLNLLHVYVWPAALTLATVAYVWLWIRWTERPAAAMGAGWRRFFVLSLAGLVLYAVSVPWMFASAALGTAGVWTAAAGATALGSFGASVTASGNTLFTSRGAFQVTQECLFTPMVPLYLAALFSVPLTRATRTWGLALALPLFFVLSVTRLLVLALPPFLVDRPTILAHGFYQLLAGSSLIVGASHLSEWRATAWAASTRAGLALAMAMAVGLVANQTWVPILTSTAGAIDVVSPSGLERLTGAADEQGALALLPAFQIGLLCGVWWALTGGRRRRALAWGLALVSVSQLCLLLGLGALASEGVYVHALALRAWAIGVPVAVAAAWAVRTSSDDS